MTTLPEYLRHALLKETKNCCAAYPYGSRMYGTFGDDSDWDFVIITSNARKKSDMKRGQLNIKYWSSDHFQYLLDEHHITALECYYLTEKPAGLPADTILPDEPWEFKLDKVKLYGSLIEKADRDWAKAEKWLRASDKTPENVLKAKKAIWHSFRILSFGCQIVALGYASYDEVNWIYHLIVKGPIESWEHCEELWLPKYNAFKKVFRKATLK